MTLTRSALCALALCTSASLTPTQVNAYPIDCAILLCMAGGFPSSPECGAAYAEVIRRVTPWPIEPPLQIWRCPMGSGGSFPITPPFGVTPETPGADISLDDPAFEFVRRIRVYEINYTSKQEGSGPDKQCYASDNTIVGYYGSQGEYYRAKSSIHTAWEDTNQVGGISDCGGRYNATGHVRAIIMKLPDVNWQNGTISYEIKRFDY